MAIKKSELYSSILDASAQYDTALVDAVNQDISKIKDIANRITDITSGHQKNVLTKNNSKLLDKTILNMVKYDKKLAAVIKEKYSDTNIFQTMEYEDAMEILNPLFVSIYTSLGNNSSIVPFIPDTIF